MQTTPTHPAKPAAPAAAAKPDDDKALPLRINGRAYSFDGDELMPLLWYLRDVLRLTGTKFGCGVGACGACTVLVDGKAQRACVTPMKTLAKREVTTIEGLANGELHPLQQAWIEIDVPQCGYCQAGQIMAAADLLKRNPNPNDEEIGKISNLCRCGTYPRIRKAIKRAAEITKEHAAREGGKS
ncbi:MAG: (2Fe-2S)-binding protein [Rudaea sp.]|uniref:(2Fe-2S)-binding protein n=1 Tax=unclassified Rudaea TaxID=2627037 RepID=UPI0010F72838|nr:MULTISPECIES: (2Fe-2S)-binding protein [unclassified Rudaea]MBN8884584.1 (2Fe-2S)-binding protein [Rudaea sp.]